MAAGAGGCHGAGEQRSDLGGELLVLRGVCERGDGKDLRTLYSDLGHLVWFRRPCSGAQGSHRALSCTELMGEMKLTTLDVVTTENISENKVGGAAGAAPPQKAFPAEAVALGARYGSPDDLCPGTGCAVSGDRRPSPMDTALGGDKKARLPRGRVSPGKSTPPRCGRPTRCSAPAVGRGWTRPRT